ncbi:ABC transporter permease [Wenjunlia tyrosinilytica]|jgi:peptide/nickel transport system permease protein|uniref:ABC transporter substrate-binding protein n=1 Tax=Wenjunlia tyrosinilytica TaxID=1544741 RepID=A0A917ZTT9_9ACTN|nr:ABC transporter permease [Wenjunlia tyrosinilytica]GGO93141.1 ABC transporter substrate-binding protein [Wenjunlia tyrosinilytica]
MLRFVIRRLVYSVPVVAAASLILFWGVRSTFDPLAKLRQGHDAGALRREVARLGLDRPVLEQYVLWMKAFATGGWGTSTRTGGDVRAMIGSALATTVQLVFWGVLLATVLALGIGVYSAVRQYSAGDYVLTALSYLGIAMPAFWCGLILIQLLAVWPKERFGLAEPPLYFVGLHSPGRSGFDMDYLRHLALPVITLTISLIASWSRFSRASMLEALSSDYVRTARAKGVPSRQIFVRHALRNSLASFVTVVALDSAILFGGLVVTEQIYAIPGMGRLFLASMLAGDVFVLIPWMLIVALATVLFNLAADLGYALLDPRVVLR